MIREHACIDSAARINRSETRDRPFSMTARSQQHRQILVEACPFAGDPE
jgi:hypothetical protein